MTPRQFTLAARIALFASFALAAFLMLGPFQGLEQNLNLSDKQAHFLAFYLLTSLTFLSFPNRRRSEMAIPIVIFGALIEVVQGMTGRSMSIEDWMMDATGAYAAVVPAWIEQIRTMVRRGGDMTLIEAWKSYDRRRFGDRAVAGAPSDDPASFGQTALAISKESPIRP